MKITKETKKNNNHYETEGPQEELEQVNVIGRKFKGGVVKK